MNSTEPQATLFTEEQKMHQWWVHLVIYALTGVAVYASLQQLVYKIPFGNNPAPDAMLVCFDLFVVLLWLLFRGMKLTTQIDQNGIRVKFFPFHLQFKSYGWNEIKAVEVSKYRPLWEYGGWGIRYGFKGMAYNMEGNMGLKITFNNHKHLLIGTQNHEELKAAIAIIAPEKLKN